MHPVLINRKGGYVIDMSLCRISVPSAHDALSVRVLV
jgi:hypothetical protein